MILEIFVRSRVQLFVVNEAESEGEHPPFMLCLRAWLRRSWMQSSSQELVFPTVVGCRRLLVRVCPLWQEMKSYPALVICVGTSRRWFPLCFQRLHSTTGRCP